MVKKNEPKTHQLKPNLITHECKSTGKTVSLPTSHCPFCMNDFSSEDTNEESN